jgi:hypothetical protein
MNVVAKWIVMSAVAVACLVGGTKVAKADDCLEIGWRDRAGAWQFYRAWIDAESGNRVHIRYEYHHGELELKIFEREKGDGEDVIVMRGRWFEGHDAQRSGRVRLQMERGHHHARGWYTNGERDDGPHFDMQLRDCRR